MRDFLQYFETEKQYNEHKANESFYLAHVDYIEETDTVKYNETLFPFYLESDEPRLEADVAHDTYCAAYYVTTPGNLYSTLEVLCLMDNSGGGCLSKENLNLCPIYVNGNKITAVCGPFFDDTESTYIEVEFEKTNWQPIDGWKFADNASFSASPFGVIYKNDDNTLVLKIGLVKYETA